MANTMTTSAIDPTYRLNSIVSAIDLLSTGSGKISCAKRMNAASHAAAAHTTTANRRRRRWGCASVVVAAAVDIAREGTTRHAQRHPPRTVPRAAQQRASTVNGPGPSRACNASRSASRWAASSRWT